MTYGYVYEVINKKNNKTYIGQRKLSLDKNWEDYYGSGKLIKQAIKKYGKGNFEKRLLCYANSKEDLTKKEYREIRRTIGNPTRGMYNIYKGVPGWSTTDFNSLPEEIKSEWNRRKLEGQRKSVKYAKAMKQKRLAAQLNRNMKKLCLYEFRDRIISEYRYGISIRELASNYNSKRSIMREFIKDVYFIHNNLEARNTPLAVKKRIQNKLNKKLNSTPILIKCLNCTEMIKTQGTRSLYCSTECKKEYRRSKTKDRDLLIIELYVNRSMSTSEVANAIGGITQPGVLKVLQRNNIKTKSHGFKSVTELKSIKNKKLKRVHS